LDINDGFRLSETGLETSVLFAEKVNLSLKWVGLGTADLGSKGGESAFGAELAPLGDLGGVDTLAAKEGAALGRAGLVGVVLFDQA
jgi:hypothetical protein